MAISYVGGVQGGRAGATTTTTQSLSGTLTGGSNTSPSAGDLVVVLCAVGSDGSGTPTSQTISGNNNGAYTTLTFQQTTTTTYDSSSQVNYKIQGGTVDTSITIPSSGNNRNAQRWVVHVFRDVNPTTPLDVTSTYATGTATGRPNPAAITPTTNGAWICAFYASAAATGAAYTAPTDFATDWLGGTTADTADVMTGGGYYTGWTSGSYDPAAISAGGTTGANDSWTATTIALRPIPPTYTKTHTSDSLKRLQTTKTHTTDSLKRKQSTVTHTTSSNIVSAVWTYGDPVTLPTNDNLLDNSYNNTDRTNVSIDDNTYKDVSGISNMIEQVWMYNSNNTDQITPTWKGKSTLAPSSSTVYLQVYNHNTNTWTTIDSDNATAADTEFTLTGSQTTSLANYYDTGNRVAIRVYQVVV